MAAVGRVLRSSANFSKAGSAPMAPIISSVAAPAAAPPPVSAPLSKSPARGKKTVNASAKPQREMPILTVKKLEEWSAWLQKNHADGFAVRTICYKKHTGEPCVPHKVAMCEAIKYGWIDTVAGRIDDDTYYRTFVKRNLKTANWSTNTLSYAKQLIEDGLMHPAGLAAYEAGLLRKPLDHGLDKVPEMPEELRQALVKAHVLKNFEADLCESKKKTLFRWLQRAKRADTRENRIVKITEMARDKKYPFFG